MEYIYKQIIIYNFTKFVDFIKYIINSLNFYQYFYAKNFLCYNIYSFKYSISMILVLRLNKKLFTLSFAKIINLNFFNLVIYYFYLNFLQNLLNFFVQKDIFSAMLFGMYIFYE
jgi:hypothetical protein